jgi:hypothetical protein
VIVLSLAAGRGRYSLDAAFGIAVAGFGFAKAVAVRFLSSS